MHVIYCAFNNPNYLNEVYYSIKSLQENGCYRGKITLLTNLDFEKQKKELNINVIYETEFYTMELSAGAKLKILEKVKLKKNELCMYLDTDVIIMKKLPDFSSITNNFWVYGYPHRTQRDKSFAGLICNDEYILRQESINTGILIFRNTELAKIVFRNAWNNYLKDINANIKISKKWEQPYLCYELCKLKLYNNILNDIVGEERDPESITNNIIFNHLCTLRGSYRVDLMKKYIK